jgi:hypothetical protein
MDAADTAHSAIVSDHPYQPRKGKWWELCIKCGLARAAHDRESKRAGKLKREQMTTRKAVPNGER